ncbi:MAG: phenylalanine--tRNA ligase subunit beta [Caulobacterales bacterium]|nr:phenylalanine--tRNA ligase subunit beta [Caulobacterales bacterium]
MKFTLSWLRRHLRTDRTISEIADAMTMAGLEVEDVIDPTERLRPFTVARIVSAERHPDADRLQVCQVETVDGMKEIVCGAPNARAGLVTIYAPIGAYVPGLGITLVEKPVRGVVSNGMLCSAAELELDGESDGILDLDDALAVGTPAAEVFGLEAVIDFEVTPNRPDWLGVLGIARDLDAAGQGQLIPHPATPVPGLFPNPISVKLEATQLCPVFAGRLIRGVRNGPSPAWLQDRLRSIGLRPINALVDITNLISYDRARPLHVYDRAKLVGDQIVVRGGQVATDTGESERLIALDGKTYAPGPRMCVIADAQGERPIGLGGVMGGESTGCDDATTDVFVESAWFDPIVTAQTGRQLGITSDAQYRFARGIDTHSAVDGLEIATALILDLCGGEPSEITVAGEPPAAPAAFEFDPSLVERLTGLRLPSVRIATILTALGFAVEHGNDPWRVTPPTWRRDVHGPADLVEEVARINGFDHLPSTPLPDLGSPPAGILSPRQARLRAARRTLAAYGWAEAVTWSFTRRDIAECFGGGAQRLVLDNPIASDLDCMRPSILPNLIQAAARNADRGFDDVALFEIGPVYRGDRPGDQRTAISGLIAPHAARRWDGGRGDDLFSMKSDIMRLLDILGVNTAALQLVQGQTAAWWHPGQSARLQLGPKTVIAEFGALHPRVLKTLDAEGPMLAFEIDVEALPQSKAKATKARSRLELSTLMPLSRDFAFVVDQTLAAGDLVRAVQGADRQLIDQARVFDVYQGAGVPDGKKSLALEVTIQPRDATLTEAEIEALSSRIVAAAEKLGATLRG